MTLPTAAHEPAPATSSTQAIKNLIARYSHAVDQGDVRAVGALFAHGQLDTGLQVADGSAAVEAVLRHNLQVYPDGTPCTMHVTTNLLLEVDEAAGTASATSCLTILQADPDSSFPHQAIMTGQYHDRFHRLHGEWHFQRRALAAGLVGDLSRHASAASGFIQAESLEA